MIILKKNQIFFWGEQLNRAKKRIQLIFQVDTSKKLKFLFPIIFLDISLIYPGHGQIKNF